MKVGFIGLGIMGKPMCKNLIKAGHDLIVTTHNPDTLKEMEALGAKAVHNGKEVAEERIPPMLLFCSAYFYCSKYSSDMSYLWNIFFYLYSH